VDTVLTPKLPNYDYSLLIRTDFSNDAAWARVCEAIQQPQTEDLFQAYVECISDVACKDLDLHDIATLLPKDDHRSFVFLADQRTMIDSEQAVLVVNLIEGEGGSFRVIPSEAWGVENNLRIANMDFHEFADAVDDDGVFRGF
jgi:hypothetical protein